MKVEEPQSKCTLSRALKTFNCSRPTRFLRSIPLQVVFDTKDYIFAAKKTKRERDYTELLRYWIPWEGLCLLFVFMLLKNQNKNGEMVVATVCINTKRESLGRQGTEPYVTCWKF